MAEERAQRRLAAIMAADVVGYSRLMGEDETGTLSALKELRAKLIDPTIAEFQGRIVKLMGDGALVEFASVVDAVECAVSIQRDMAERTADLTDSKRIVLRIGVNLGDVIIDGEDIYGDGVNVAARLEGLAKPGGICVSGKVFEEVGTKLDMGFEDLGAQQVKNIAAPVRAYRVTLDQTAAASGDEPLELPDKPSIAVLPFDNMSGDPEQEYFADGLAEDIINLLVAWRSFPVVARNSSFAFKGQSHDVRQIANELSARYIIEGSVRKSGNRVRVTAQLVDAETGHHLWADKFDGALDDIFEIQDEITRRIVASVEPEMEQAELRKAETERAANLSAWDNFLRGRAHLHLMTPDDNKQARAFFENAIALDPDYSDAFAGLSFTYQRDIHLEVAKDRQAWETEALKAARQAVALDNGSSHAHLALSGAYIWSNQHDLSIAETRTAVELNPSNVQACLALGNRLDIVGKPEEGIPLLEKSLALNPRDPHGHTYYAQLARANINARNYDKALECVHEALRRKDDHPHTYHVMAICLGHLGRIEEARKAARRCEEIRPGFLKRRAHWNIYLDPAANEHLTEGLRKSGLLDDLEAGDEAPPLPDKPSIAVLPFDNISNDPEQEYFSDGITEDIITELSKISGLFVIARHSAFTYKGKSVTLKQVGRELGVRYVLEGSVRKAGDRLRITGQLIDAETDHHLWAERYDRNLEDIFAVQDEVARQVAGALAVALKPGEAERLAHAPTDNLEAYDVYLRTRMTFFPPTRANVLTARGAYGHVVDTDPSFAGGHAGKSITHSMAVMFGHSENPEEDTRIALEFAERAVTMDDQFALSHSALGFAYSVARRHNEAIAVARRAVELQPGDADSHFFLAYCQLQAAEGEQARDSILTALRLDPQYVAGPYLNALGRACFVAGRFEEASETFERNVAHGGPLGVPMLATWLTSLVELGRIDDAREIAQRLVEFDPGFSLTRAGNDAFGLASEASRDRIIEALRKVGLPE